MENAGFVSSTVGFRARPASSDKPPGLLGSGPRSRYEGEGFGVGVEGLGV